MKATTLRMLLLAVGLGGCSGADPAASPSTPGGEATSSAGSLGPIQVMASISVDGDVIKEMLLSVEDSGAPTSLQITTASGLAVGVTARRLPSSLAGGSVMEVEVEGAGGVWGRSSVSLSQLRLGAVFDAGGPSVHLGIPPAFQAFKASGITPNRPIEYCRCVCNEIITSCCAKSPIECCSCGPVTCCD